MKQNSTIKPDGEKKPTFGEQYIKGVQSASGKAPVSEIRDGLLSEWDKNVFEVIEKSRKIIPSRHFYICVTTKREFLVKNTIRNYFESKYDCPTPQYEQAVYRIRTGGNEWQLMWVIPNKEACIYLKNNALLVPEEEKQLLNWVIDFSEGKLDQLAQKENKEPIQKIEIN